ncbi:hypothetical protein [Candidatus Viadribacter manganicus]|uniref:Lipoprotein n=1 Tax=Candidatus Viadribacter manganicus TaxID=1759059 RepID=A0A1B1ALK7_9PROT|nr:hypothetical protein [Candidatus Viadribacter manganicus]ANP47452.1 hypothetical protein ATE48_16820 [Candidatus Viadribacter manganicus]
MIRFLFIGALAFAGACTQQQAGRCDFTHSREIAFSGGAEPDRVTVRTFGVACDKAIGLYEIADGEGHPIWAWASPLPRAFGDVFTADEPERVEAFLEEWSQPAVETTSSAPPFGELYPGQTTLDELTYADIQARDLPMLCHFSGTARQTCVFWEPAAGGAGHFFDRDVEETVE